MTTESSARILVVDDERGIRRFLHTALVGAGYAIVEAETGTEAIAAAAAARPDVVILDLGLPDMDGLDVLRALREWSGVPVIILSVREQETQKIAALDSGADDYLTKPFGVGELLARLRVLLRRRPQGGEGPLYTNGDLTVDLARRSVRRSDDEVQLTPTEYGLLRELVQHAGRVLTHRQLLRAVWGVAYEGELHLLRVNISNLRRKLEPQPTRPRYILTEPGVGYRLAADEGALQT